MKATMVVPLPGDGVFPAQGRTVEIFNQCIFFGLLIAVIISGLQVLRGVHRLVRGMPDRAPSQA